MMSDSFLKFLGAERSLKRLVVVVNAMLGLLLGYQLTFLMGVVGDDREVVLPAQRDGQVRLADRKQDEVSATPLEHVHLFGEPHAEKRQGTVTQAPEVRPKLTLRGIIHSTNRRSARAIIAVSSGRDVAYPLGARLPGGMRLTEINHRDVVILHRGRQELLHLSHRAAHGN